MNLPPRVRVNNTKVSAVTGIKTCRRCGEIKPLDKFALRTGRSFDQRGPYCVECVNKYHVEWHKKHKTEHNKRIMEIYHNRKKMIFNAYGNKCACCGEANPLFLTLDHKNNDGAIERKSLTRYESGRSGGYRVYQKVIKEHYPDRYQLLCWNCNCGKRVNKGVCPHDTTK